MKKKKKFGLHPLGYESAVRYLNKIGKLDMVTKGRSSDKWVDGLYVRLAAEMYYRDGKDAKDGSIVFAADVLSKAHERVVVKIERDIVYGKANRQIILPSEGTGTSGRPEHIGIGLQIKEIIGEIKSR